MFATTRRRISHQSFVESDGSVLGDLDGDCDVDLLDHAMMQARFTGPN
jgi:hypothetical protein